MTRKDRIRRLLFFTLLLSQGAEAMHGEPGFWFGFIVYGIPLLILGSPFVVAAIVLVERSDRASRKYRREPEDLAARAELLRQELQRLREP